MANHEGPCRLWITPPQPDETTSSVIDRACAFLNTNRERVVDALCGGMTPYHRDADRHFGLRAAVGRAFGKDEDDPIGSEVSEEALTPFARVTYCPVCFEADLKARCAPYFRWQWTNSYVTFCHVHGTPLFVWRCVRDQQRVIPRAWAASPGAEHAGDCAWLREDLALVKEASAEMERSGAPLRVVKDLQERLCMFELGPRQCITPYRLTLVSTVNRYIRKGSKPLGCSRPAAAELISKYRLDRRFFNNPYSYREAREFIRVGTFRGVRSVEWRRALLWYAAVNMETSFATAVKGRDKSELSISWKRYARMTDAVRCWERQGRLGL